MISWILVLVLSVGCVPKGKYNESLADNEELRNRMDGMTDAMNGMGVEIADLRNGLETTTAELTSAQARLESKSAEAGELEQNLEQMQAAMAELEQRRARAEAAMASYRDLVGRFQAMIDAGTLQVKVIDGRMVVELATDILFPAGSATLSKEGQAAIKEVAGILAGIEDRAFQVAGHTDNRPIATAAFPSNWHLGAARAISVANLLIDSGMSAEAVSVASYSDNKPADTNRTREGRAANRRIEIVIMPDMSQLPGYEELQGAAAEVDE